MKYPLWPQLSPGGLAQLCGQQPSCMQMTSVGAAVGVYGSMEEGWTLVTAGG